VFVFDMFRELVDMLGHNDNHPSVLANTLTFDAMQPEAAVSLREHDVDIVPVGSCSPSFTAR
jgi:hypothetical protein